MRDWLSATVDTLNTQVGQLGALPCSNSLSVRWT